MCRDAVIGQMETCLTNAKRYIVLIWYWSPGDETDLGTTGGQPCLESRDGWRLLEFNPLNRDIE